MIFHAIPVPDTLCSNHHILRFTSLNGSMEFIGFATIKRCSQKKYCFLPKRMRIRTVSNSIWHLKSSTSSKKIVSGSSQLPEREEEYSRKKKVKLNDDGCENFSEQEWKMQEQALISWWRHPFLESMHRCSCKKVSFKTRLPSQTWAMFLHA